MAPRARGVKAFTIHGFENLEDNADPGHGVKPAMLFRGDAAAAKQAVGERIARLG
ncbi:MAG: hypothetical protein U1F50_13770 [Rubrivivax sp.]